MGLGVGDDTEATVRRQTARICQQKKVKLIEETI